MSKSLYGTKSHTSFLAFPVRYNSDVPSKKQEAPIQQSDWKQINQFIPGEKTQTDSLSDRMPKFPLGKENVPTLLPRPGIPKVGKNVTFRQVINILKNKTEPELIYENEPHRLYFLICVCFGATLLIYSIVLGEWAIFQATKDFNENTEEKNDVIRKREWVLSLLKNSVYSVITLAAAYYIFTFPSRLVRRMWYLPGPVEHVKFTTYPLVPGRSTPVVTLPLEALERKHKARVWTGRGFYGTSDASFFFFVLQEVKNGKTVKNWVVDRKGFFWSDGRVFDYIFGKETIAEAEAGVPYDEQVGIINRELKKKKQKLRKEQGIFYGLKFQGEEMKKDARRLMGKDDLKKLK
ncbi:hypothetical protein PSN45_001876 [Yamadazyma tenuis]|nr:hypothetical protein PSN45_001876 [Yamadazyma tenuis]